MLRSRHRGDTGILEVGGGGGGGGGIAYLNHVYVNYFILQFEGGEAPPLPLRLPLRKGVSTSREHGYNFKLA